MNKKGLKHFFDLMSMVVFGFFMLLFISMALNIGVNNSNEASISELDALTLGFGAAGVVYYYVSNYVSNLDNAEIDVFSNMDINEAIRNAQVVEGYTAVTCFDLGEKQCSGQMAGYKCIWKDGVCQNDE